MSKLSKSILALAWLAANTLSAQSIGADTLLNGSITSSFSNPVADAARKFVYVIDNDLTNGTASVLNPIPFSTTTGASAFSWGTASSNNTLTSALWFEPGNLTNVVPETSFEIGRLFYRNGTIVADTGASQVDLNMKLTFTSPQLQNPTQTISSTLSMINTPNGNDPIASADYVEIGSPASLLTFTDANNRQYYLELTFQVDQNATDGSLSDCDTFHVFEGQTGQAVLMGRVTVAPVPEPGGAVLIAATGMALLLRRRRRA